LIFSSRTVFTSCLFEFPYLVGRITVNTCG
jgi:hypothetical protein